MGGVSELLILRIYSLVVSCLLMLALLYGVMASEDRTDRLIAFGFLVAYLPMVFYLWIK